MKRSVTLIMLFLLFGGILSMVSVSLAGEDVWTRKANMPTARAYSSASAVDGKIYVIGGGWPVNFHNVEMYDPLTDTWIKKADKPTPEDASTSVVDGKIYAIGGSDANANWQPLSTVEVYDPAMDEWTKRAHAPTPRSACGINAVGGKVYVIGGKDAGFWGISAVEVYDPATDTWSKKADMPTARGFLSTAAVGGKIYAIGGGTGGGNCAPLKEGIVEEYDTGFVPQSVDSNGKLPTMWGRMKKAQQP